ncbi:hypothetical protein MHBO_000455 [Bonamia ostreae]|uniref:Uncharacterized protein n=1 Tax=Bonamia ostreae TaxID=126728 RepID=A0ABV2AFP9_9EUKA
MGSEDRFKVFGIPFDNIDNFANSEILSVKAIFDMALILFEKNYGENDLAKFFEREKNLEKMAFLSQTGFTNLLFSFLQNESVLIRKQAIQIFTNSVQLLKILANIRRKFGKSELAENSLIDKMNVILSKELNLDNERILVLEIQKMAAFFDLGEKANLVLQNRQIENCVVNFLLGILTLPFKNIWATAKNTLISMFRNLNFKTEKRGKRRFIEFGNKLFKISFDQN